MGIEFFWGVFVLLLVFSVSSFIVNISTDTIIGNIRGFGCSVVFAIWAVVILQFLL